MFFTVNFLDTQLLGGTLDSISLPQGFKKKILTEKLKIKSKIGTRYGLKSFALAFSKRSRVELAYDIFRYYGFKM